MTTWSHLLPRSVRGVITSFQSQYDKYFTVPNPLIYFREYHLSGHYPEILLFLKQCSKLLISVPDKIQGEYFRNLGVLRSLDTQGPLTDDMAPYLTSLKYLKIGKTTCCSPNSFRFLVRLEQFAWYGHIDGIDGNQVFKHLKNLHILSCQYTLTKNLDTSIITQMSSLRWLLFGRSDNIDDSVLQALPNLEVINVNERITDHGIRHLTKLHSVGLSSNHGVTYSALHGKPLRVLLCPRDVSFFDHRVVSFGRTLEVLCLGNSQDVTDKTLQQLPRLRELVINSNTRITDRGILALPRLQMLSVGCSQGITDKSLVTLTDLRFLFLWANTNVVGTCFKSLKKLTHLGLGLCTKITPGAVRLLTNLETLHLGRNRRVASGNLTTLSKMKTIYMGDNSRPPMTVPNVEIKFEVYLVCFDFVRDSFFA